MSHSWVVLKYGGTSVASLDRWGRIAERIRALAPNHRVCVVVSALAGVTDSLGRAIDEALGGDSPGGMEAIRETHRRLARDGGLASRDLVPMDQVFDEVDRLLDGVRLIREASPKLRARILAAGEMASSRLGAALLGRQGVKAHWLDASTILCSESHPREREADRYLEARVRTQRDPGRLEIQAGSAGVVITQGFVASTREGELCLLGRGGSDASAALLAGLVGADLLEIWSDVHGMFTADPGITPEARLIRRLGYREAQELAGLGAKVLHPRTLEPVTRDRIPLRIRCIDAPEEPGTLVESSAPEHPTVTAVTHRKGVTLVAVSTVAMYGVPGFLARAFEAFEAHGLSVDLVATSQTAVTVSLDRVPGGVQGREFVQLVARLGELGHVTVIQPCAVVAVVGRRIRAVLHRIGPALEVLRDRPVHLVSDSSEDLNLSFVVDESDGPALVASLHHRLISQAEGDPNLGPAWEQLSRNAETQRSPR